MSETHIRDITGGWLSCNTYVVIDVVSSVVERWRDGEGSGCRSDHQEENLQRRKLLFRGSEGFGSGAIRGAYLRGVHVVGVWRTDATDVPPRRSVRFLYSEGGAAEFVGANRVRKKRKQMGGVDVRTRGGPFFLHLLPNDDTPAP